MARQPKQDIYPPWFDLIYQQISVHELPVATAYEPGSDLKVALLARRNAAGIPLWLTGDREYAPEHIELDGIDSVRDQYSNTGGDDEW